MELGGGRKKDTDTPPHTHTYTHTHRLTTGTFQLVRVILAFSKKTIIKTLVIMPHPRTLFRSQKREEKREKKRTEKHKSYLSYHFLFLHKPKGTAGEHFKAVVLGHTFHSFPSAPLPPPNLDI